MTTMHDDLAGHLALFDKTLEVAVTALARNAARAVITVIEAVDTEYVASAELAATNAAIEAVCFICNRAPVPAVWLRDAFWGALGEATTGTPWEVVYDGLSRRLRLIG